MNEFLENNFLSSKPIFSPPWCNCIGYQSMKSFLAANKICVCAPATKKWEFGCMLAQMLAQRNKRKEMDALLLHFSSLFFPPRFQ